jgi:hypothetical protein
VLIGFVFPIQIRHAGKMLLFRYYLIYLYSDWMKHSIPDALAKASERSGICVSYLTVSILPSLQVDSLII